MTTSNKSAGGGTPSGSEVQTGSSGVTSLHEVPRPTPPGRDGLELTRYDYGGLMQLIDQLDKVRVLAEAGSAWTQAYRGCQLNRDEVTSLFDGITEKLEQSAKDLSNYLDELQGESAAMTGGVR